MSEAAQELLDDIWERRTWFDDGLAQSVTPAGDVKSVLALAHCAEHLATSWGSSTLSTLFGLATLGAVDLTTARILEPHLDALAILHQAERDPEQITGSARSTWGVFAASAPGRNLHATRTATAWTLSGTKPWCSLARDLTHALVTASDGTDQRLFAVHLRDPRITVHGGGWCPVGLRDVDTVTLTFDDVQAIAIEGPGWYLNRAGFAWGAIGVAAVWWGAATAVAGRLLTAARRRDPDQIALMSIGACDTALTSGLQALQYAARTIDEEAGQSDSSSAGTLLAARVRAIIAAASEDVVATVGHALGPAPLAYDPWHARRIADLTLYLRQHHAERDLAALGRHILAVSTVPG